MVRLHYARISRETKAAFSNYSYFMNEIFLTLIFLQALISS